MRITPLQRSMQGDGDIGAWGDQALISVSMHKRLQAGCALGRMCFSHASTQRGSPLDAMRSSGEEKRRCESSKPPRGPVMTAWHRGHGRVSSSKLGEERRVSYESFPPSSIPATLPRVGWSGTARREQTQLPCSQCMMRHAKAQAWKVAESGLADSQGWGTPDLDTDEAPT
jgi:hypothetical protein